MKYPLFSSCKELGGIFGKGVVSFKESLSCQKVVPVSFVQALSIGEEVSVFFMGSASIGEVVSFPFGSL